MAVEQFSGFDCRVCGEHHDVLPLSYPVKYPIFPYPIPPEESEERVFLTADQCVIDERYHYVRGRFSIPIHGMEMSFLWDCWARIHASDFHRANQRRFDPDRVSEPHYQGLLNSELPLYGETRNLPVLVKTRAVGRRPHFLMADPEHPLAMELRNGISMDRVMQIAEWMLH